MPLCHSIHTAAMLCRLAGPVDGHRQASFQVVVPVYCSSYFSLEVVECNGMCL